MLLHNIVFSCIDYLIILTTGLLINHKTTRFKIIKLQAKQPFDQLKYIILLKIVWFILIKQKRINLPCKWIVSFDEDLIN